MCHHMARRPCGQCTRNMHLDAEDHGPHGESQDVIDVIDFQKEVFGRKYVGIRVRLKYSKGRCTVCVGVECVWVWSVCGCAISVCASKRVCQYSPMYAHVCVHTVRVRAHRKLPNHNSTTTPFAGHFARIDCHYQTNSTDQDCLSPPVSPAVTVRE